VLVRAASENNTIGVFIPISIPTAINYNWTTASESNLTVKGVSYTLTNTALLKLVKSDPIATAMFPGVAHSWVSSTGTNLEANNTGFSLPASLDLGVFRNTTWSLSNSAVKLEGTPYKNSTGLQSSDYIPDPYPVWVGGYPGVPVSPIPVMNATAEVSGSNITVIGGLSWSFAWCPYWQQNVLISQFGLGVLLSTCANGSSQRDATACTLRLLELLGIAGGYPGEAWTTNCAICVNDAVQTVNSWTSVTRDACTQNFSSCEGIKSVATDFKNCAGFDFMVPKMAPYCEGFITANIFSSIVKTCVNVARRGSEMDSCVEYVLDQSTLDNINSNCVDSWKYLTEMIDRIPTTAEKSSCIDDVTSDECRASISTSIENFRVWNGFDPTILFYAIPIGGPGIAESAAGGIISIDTAVLIATIGMLFGL
jgi:hypothetical protein